jgi:hypothetical protein
MILQAAIMPCICFLVTMIPLLTSVDQLPPEGLSVGAAGTFNEIITDTYFLAFFDNGEFWITVEETARKHGI